MRVETLVQGAEAGGAVDARPLAAALCSPKRFRFAVYSESYCC